MMRPGVRRPRAPRWAAALALGAALAVLAGCGDPRPGPGAAPADTAGPGPPRIDTAAAVSLTGFDTVFVYFTTLDEVQVPQPRAVADTVHALRAAMVELLKGPTPREREAGLTSWFSEETAGMLRSVSVRDGFAVVDFEDLRPVIPNAVSSAGALMLLDELTATAFQFPAIRRVELRIEGSCEALMAWLQVGCHPIVRSSWDAPPAFRTAVR